LFIRCNYIVFEDDLGTHLPRQLIAEKIKSASEKKSHLVLNPQMGPITTGALRNLPIHTRS
jgi:cobalt-zinc-cadmium resistance protein CzcA